jgi:hypothetical protein
MTECIIGAAIGSSLGIVVTVLAFVAVVYLRARGVDELGRPL